MSPTRIDGRPFSPGWINQPGLQRLAPAAAYHNPFSYINHLNIEENIKRFCTNMLSYGQNATCIRCINHMQSSRGSCTQYPNLLASPLSVGRTICTDLMHSPRDNLHKRSRFCIVKDISILGTIESP
jgi:hypothetical protein